MGMRLFGIKLEIIGKQKNTFCSISVQKVMSSNLLDWEKC